MTNPNMVWVCFPNFMVFVPPVKRTLRAPRLRTFREHDRVYLPLSGGCETHLRSRQQQEPSVPNYHMHLIDSIDVLLDSDGVEVACEDVSSAALRAPRDCMAGDVHNGRLDLHYRIEWLMRAGR